MSKNKNTNLEIAKKPIQKSKRPNKSKVPGAINTSLKIVTNPIQPPKPLYQQVKSFVLERIESNEWPTYYQIPSEHTLVRDMGISRMTIHRALRELTHDGHLNRIQGVGTFVSKSRVKKETIEFKNIDIAITESGNHHTSTVHFLQAEPISSDYAVRLGLKPGESVFRAYIVHRENGVPVMLEDRYVNTALCPDFLNQNYLEKTTDNYFSEIFSRLSHDHQLQAVISTPEAHHFLDLEQPVPCIQINRRTWTGNKILSVAHQLYVGSRYQITC
ncbi:MAG: UTRA domain-containing protein [Sneathiella sp.]